MTRKQILLVLWLVVGACKPSAPTADKLPAPPALTLDDVRCGAAVKNGTCPLFDVSLYELLANPLTYHGKRVRVMGYVHWDIMGDDMLFAHREDYDRNLVWNGIGIVRPADVDSTSHGYVLVESTYTADIRGHLGGIRGGLSQVTRLERWERPRQVPYDSIPVIDLRDPP